MAIEKLTEFAKDGQKNVDGLTETDGFPVLTKPARQWFNWLFNSITTKINEIIDQKIDFEDIIDNLTTNDATKPLSAKQGKDLQDNKLGKNANAVSATKLQTPRKINGVDFDGSTDISIPTATTSVSGTVQLNNTLTSTSTTEALTAAQGKVLNDRFINDFLNLKSVNGYQKLPMGLIIQWGESQLIPDESSITGSFPIVFPNVCLSIQATINIDTLTNGTRSVYAKKISTAQFKLTNDSVNTLPAVTAFWLAIGY